MWAALYHISDKHHLQFFIFKNSLVEKINAPYVKNIIFTTLVGTFGPRNVTRTHTNVFRAHTHTHTHIFICELWGLSIDFYYLYTDQTILYIPNPKLIPHRKQVRILTLSDKHHLIFLLFFSPSWGPNAIKNVRFYYPCGDIWSPQCSVNKHGHRHRFFQTNQNNTLEQYKCFSGDSGSA